MKKEQLKPELKDYLAMIIAAFQTVALPLVLLFFIILAVAIVFGVIAGMFP